MTGAYIHIPFCAKKCDYCSFYSVPKHGQDISSYISCLLKELNQEVGFIQNCDTIYIGGGSPSCLPEEELLRLIDWLSYTAENCKEFTVEVNPSQVDSYVLSALNARGVNRLSIGAQSFIQHELDFLTRPYDVAQIEETYELARHLGFKNISLDFIFALPGSRLEDWKYSLRRAIDLSPEHISAYSLTYEDGTPLFLKREDGQIDALGEVEDHEMYELAIDMLEKAGYKQYEVSNFAKPAYDCKHNTIYWLNDDYLGFGAGASSYFGKKRWSNISSVEEYIKRISVGTSPASEKVKLSDIEYACETAVLMLRRINGIDIDVYEEKTGYNPINLFKSELDENVKLGNLEIVNGSIRLTRSALPIADSVLCDFSSTQDM